MIWRTESHDILGICAGQRIFNLLCCNRMGSEFWEWQGVAGSKIVCLSALLGLSGNRCRFRSLLDMLGPCVPASNGSLAQLCQKAL